MDIGESTPVQENSHSGASYKETPLTQNNQEESLPRVRVLGTPQDGEIKHQDPEIAVSDEYSSYIYGPSVRLHRVDIGKRVLQLLILVWLLSGMVFLLAIMFCVFVSTGYVTFKSDGRLAMVVFAFLFFLSYQFSFLRSLVRTFIKMCMLVWRAQFGGSDRDLFVLRWVDYIYSSDGMNNGWPAWLTFSNRAVDDKVDPSTSNVDTDILSTRVNYTKAFMLFLIIMLFVGIPLISVASIFGYWAVISVLCALMTIGSASTILLINILARFRRSLRFFYSLYKTSNMSKRMDRTRAAYIATVGHDHGRNMIDVLSEKALILLIIAAFCSIVFRGFKVNAIAMITCFVLMIFFLSARYRRKLQCYNQHLDSVPVSAAAGPPPKSANVVIRNLVNLEWNDYYRGQEGNHVLIIFLNRCLVFAVGIASLCYLDMSEVRSTNGKMPIELIPVENAVAILISFSSVFFISTVFRDVLFFLPHIHGKVRPFLLAFCSLVQLTIGIIGKAVLPSCFTFIALLVISVVELDYREARYFWPSRLRRKVLSKEHKRTMRNAFIMIGTFCSIILVSFLVGMFVGTTKTQEITEADLQAIFGNYSTSNSFTFKQEVYASPICSMQFTKNALSVLDLATMSNAAYQLTKDDALKYVHMNPRLTDWSIGQYKLDNSNYDLPSLDPLQAYDASGARFAEFISPKNVSVIAIRGTYKLEDLFQDMYLWSTVGLLQVSSYFGTFTGAWPSDTFARLVYFINRIAAYPNLIYWDEMQQLVQEIVDSKKKLPGASLSDINSKVAGSMVMITGHSLGGGLSNIVGAHLEIPSVTFSAPGLGYSIYNYNLTIDAIMKHTINIVPQSDPVAMFDMQAGQVVNVWCKAGNPMDCHSIDRTVVTIADICGVYVLTDSSSLA